MKRVLGIVLGSAMAFAGCATDEDASSPSGFTASYQNGLYVVAAGKITSETKQYVNLDGKVTQVDNLAAAATTSATSGVCEIDPDMPVTVSQSEVSATTRTRVAGTQKAWILPGTYYPYNNLEADQNWNSTDSDNSWAPGVHVWGDVSYGDMFFTEPKIDVWVHMQAEADCNCEIDQYLETIPVELSIFETEEERFTLDVDTYKQTNPDYNETTTSRSYWDNSVGSFTRFVLEGLVWETTDIGVWNNNFYTGNGREYWADMILPDSVQGGDTWIDDNGELIAAIGMESIRVADMNVRALHIVRRGTKDSDTIAQGVADSCLDIHETYNEDNDGVITKAKRATLKPACRQNGENMGWVNYVHEWYYKGVLVKSVEDTSSVSIQRYGFVAANDGNLPASSEGGGFVAVGQCEQDRYTVGGGTDDAPEVTATADEPEQLDRLQPFIEYTVTNSKEVWEATEIRDDYSIVQEYKESGEAETL